MPREQVWCMCQTEDAPCHDEQSWKSLQQSTESVRLQDSIFWTPCASMTLLAIEQGFTLLLSLKRGICGAHWHQGAMQTLAMLLTKETLLRDQPSKQSQLDIFVKKIAAAP